MLKRNLSINCITGNTVFDLQEMIFKLNKKIINPTCLNSVLKLKTEFNLPNTGLWYEDLLQTGSWALLDGQTDKHDELRRVTI